jgi:hypothetical protein
MVDVWYAYYGGAIASMIRRSIGVTAGRLEEDADVGAIVDVGG